MARQRSKRRISKEQLALVARKNFNAQPVNENEAIVELLYRIRTKGESGRRRFVDSLRKLTHIQKGLFG